MDQHTEQNKCNDILPMFMELFCLRLRLNNLIPVMFPFHIPFPYSQSWRRRGQGAVAFYVAPPSSRMTPPALVSTVDTSSGLKFRFLTNLFSMHLICVTSVDLYQQPLETDRITGVAHDWVEWSGNNLRRNLPVTGMKKKCLSIFAFKWSHFLFSYVWHSKYIFTVLSSVHIFDII